MANANAPAQTETRQLNRREDKSRAWFNMKMSVSFLDLPKPLWCFGARGTALPGACIVQGLRCGSGGIWEPACALHRNV